MNLRLSRIFLRGVGPASARYDPLLTDLRNADGRADHALVWLRNGGGKTTLERLIFHVLAWNDARSVGKEDKTRPGGIEYLLGPDDVGHVVLEWVRDDAPDALALITGLVCQLQPGSGHRRDDDGNLKRSRTDVERRFYCFHARDGIDLEAIADMQVSDGRRLSLRTYAKALDDLNGTHPRLRLDITSAVNEWTAMLQDRGLDGDLFRYQVQMNQGEGGADQVIARAATNERFVDFVLRAVTPPSDIADVGKQFERYREDLAQMPALGKRRAFVASLQDAMARLADAHQAEASAAGDLAAAEADARVLHGRFAAAAERERRTMQSAAEAKATLQRERTTADSTRKRLNEEAAWLEHWGLSRRLEAVIAELTGVEQAQGQAQLDASAWPLAADVIGRDAADALARQLEAALRARNDQTAPLREQRDRFAAALKASYLQAAERHEHAQRNAEDEAGEHRRAAQEHEAQASGADRDAATAAQLIRQAQTELDEFTRARGQAVADGLLTRDQSPSEAREALLAEAQDRRQTATRCEDEAAQAVGDAETARADRDHAQRDADRALGRRDEARRQREQHDREHAEVAAMPSVAELAEQPDIDLHAAGDVLAAAVRDRVSSIDAEHREVAGRLDHVQRDLQALADRRLLAPRLGVTQALEALAAERIDAISGFQYLDDATAPAARDRLVARHPHLADGVVLTRPDADLDHALVALERAGLAPTFPVAVAPADVLLDADPDVQWRVWGGDPALYDRAAADLRRGTLEQEQAQLTGRSQELSLTAEQGRQAAAALDDLLRRWPQARLTKLNADLASAADALQSATERVQAARTRLQAAQTAEQHARAGAQTARQAADDAFDRAQRLEEAARAERAAAGAEDRLSLQRERQQAATDAAAAHRTAANASHEAREAALTRRTEQANAGARAHADAAGVIAVETEPEPALLADPAESLARQLGLAQRRLDSETQDDQLAQELTQARDDSERHSRRLRSAPSPVAERAAELAAEPTAHTPESQAREARNAAEAEQRLARRRSQLNEDKGSLRSQLDRVSQDRTAPEQAPGSVEDAAMMRERVLDATSRQRADVEALDRRIAQFADTQRDAERDAEVFDSLVDRLLDAPAQPDAYADNTMRAREDRDEDRTRRDRLQAEVNRRHQAVEAARGTVNNRLRDPAAQAAEDLVAKLAATGDGALVTHARELADDLNSQVALIDERLGAMENDKQLIISFLEPRVSDAISRLRALQRLSRLPESLGGAWAGREFLTIRFEKPGDAGRRLALVGKALDELLQSPTTPDGFGMLLHATLTVLGSVRVLILKPEPGLPSVQPIPVSGISDLSGGERATIAILLYCALSNLRRETLARSGQLAAVSCLLLDNPLGKASSGFLVDQQMQMATALGIQLVYATAIDDTNALDRFPVLVRLRNRQDLTRSMRYVRHDGGPAVASTNGHAPTIEAARLVRRAPETP